MVDATAVISIGAAVSDERVLGECLAKSPEMVASGISLETYRGFDNAARALNAAIEAADTPWIVLAHQDVYFPKGSLKRMAWFLSELDETIAVAGLIGRTSAGETVGEVWSSGMQRVVGEAIDSPRLVDTIDELVIAIRLSSLLRFDEALPGFHLYGTDIVRIAARHGLQTAVLPVSVIHHSRPVISLGTDYAAPYRYLKKKWRDQLPITTMMGDIRAFPLHRLRLDLRVRRAAQFARIRRDPEGDPGLIARSLGWE